MNKKGFIAMFVELLLVISLLALVMWEYKSNKEDQSFEELYNMTKGEYNCMDFCSPGKYYYKEDYFSSTCACNFGVKDG